MEKKQHYSRRKDTIALMISLLISASAFSESSDLVKQSFAELAAKPVVSAAFTFLYNENEQNLLDLIELTEIPAPPFGESKRADRFVEMIKETGLSDVSIDEVGNVIGRRPGSSDYTIAMVAHMDTVFPIETDVTVRKEGNTYYAPGIGDNTRGMVVLLSILRAFETLDIQTDANILFIGGVGEEGLGDLRGVRHLFRDGGSRIDSFIAIDGGRLDRLVHRGVGSHRYKVTISGPGGHSWGDFGAVNPHHALGRVIDSFVEKAKPLSESGEKLSFNIGRIGGGTSINSIPFESWFEVDMRSGSQERLNEMDDVFMQAVAGGIEAENNSRQKGDAELNVDIASVGKRPAGATPESAKLVIHAMEALKFVGVAEPNLSQSSTDSNIPMSKGVPAITISRGGKGKGAHSPAESWTNEDAHLALQSGFLLLLAEAGLSE